MENSSEKNESTESSGGWSTNMKKKGKSREKRNVGEPKKDMRQSASGENASRPDQPGQRQFEVPSDSKRVKSSWLSSSGVSQGHVSAVETTQPAKQAELPREGEKKDSSSPRIKLDRSRLPGRKITIETNVVSLKCTAKCTYHYDVKFVPDRPRALFQSIMLELIRRKFKGCHPAFDGVANVLSSKLLPNVGEGELVTELEVLNENLRAMKFKVILTYVRKLDMSILERYVGLQEMSGMKEAIWAMNIVLRSQSALQNVQSGRCFFTPPERIIRLGEDGTVLWTGFFQSAITGWKPFLNFDVVHQSFPEACNVLQTIETVCNLRGAVTNEYLTSAQKDKLRKYISKLKIQFGLPGIPTSIRLYRVLDVVEAARDLRFNFQERTMMSVEEYFAKEKGFVLKYPLLPCLWVGSLNKTICLPVELCQVVKGQVVNRSSTNNNLVKHATVSTAERKRKILQQLQNAGFNSSAIVKEFSITVGGKFEKVEARVLDPPVLKYKDVEVKGIHNNQFGVWRPVKTKFLQSATIRKWCVLSLDGRVRRGDLNRLQDMIVDVGKSLGMDIPLASMAPVMCNPQPTPKRDDLVEFMNKNKDMSVIIVVIADDYNYSYNRVKRISETRVGVLTQCIKGFTLIKKLDFVTINNLLLKINAKLNGTNHSLADMSLPAFLNPRKPVMVMGADVTHPAAMNSTEPSVAAVVASYDPRAFKYSMISRMQKPREEMIVDLEAITKTMLERFFRKSNGVKPECLLFLRDGVSDDQIPAVRDVELSAIRRACRSMPGGDYQPRVTFVIVQKRHHIRLFPTDQKDSQDRNLNCPAGTVLDSNIVHPRDIDFYLLSHASIQGTSRPTKYRVVHDDSELSEPVLEEVIYYLCYLFARCTRSVSYPAPTYYAHLAAARANVYVKGEGVNLEDLTKEQEDRKVLLDQNPMFFV